MFTCTCMYNLYTPEVSYTEWIQSCETKKVKKKKDKQNPKFHLGKQKKKSNLPSVSIVSYNGNMVDFFLPLFSVIFP